MYASSLYLEPETVQIKEIDKSQTGKVLSIKGTAVNVTNSGEHLFMDLEDSTGSILVVDFDSEHSVSEDANVSVIGSVELYEGDLEIIARDIKKD
jgi:RecJ-like exonuclease